MADVYKGQKRPNIGSHGSAVQVADIQSGIAEPAHPVSTFAPDPSDIPPGDGVRIFKFPLEDVSAGNFWTRLIINSWIPVTRDKEVVTGQNHSLDKDTIANIWLPMPLTLSTSYQQKYTETENMMVNRGTKDSTGMGGLQGYAATFWDQAKSAVAGAGQELAGFTSDIANVNASGKMAMGSIANQQMGLVYDGASLRPHTLSWRMTPKDREEQNAIETVCFALKKFSSPVVKGALAGDSNFANSAKAHQKAVKDVEKESQKGKKDVSPAAMKDVQDSLRSIGRLGIPVTVNVEFWFGKERNPHLFQIKDSFIQSVEVNYTPTGTWNAYEDGAPIETQLTVQLKENAIITQEDIEFGGGY